MADKPETRDDRKERIKERMDSIREERRQPKTDRENFENSLNNVAEELRKMNFDRKGPLAFLQKSGETNARLLQANIAIKDYMAENAESSKESSIVLDRLEELSKEGIKADAEESARLVKELKKLDKVIDVTVGDDSEKKKLKELSASITKDVKKNASIIQRMSQRIGESIPDIAGTVAAVTGSPLAGLVTNWGTKGIGNLLGKMGNKKNQSETADSLLGILDRTYTEKSHGEIRGTAGGFSRGSPEIESSGFSEPESPVNMGSDETIKQEFQKTRDVIQESIDSLKEKIAENEKTPEEKKDEIERQNKMIHELEKMRSSGVSHNTKKGGFAKVAASIGKEGIVNKMIDVVKGGVGNVIGGASTIWGGGWLAKKLGFGKKAAKEGAEKLAEKEGKGFFSKILGKILGKEGAKIVEKEGGKVAAKTLSKKIPILGALFGLGYAAKRSWEGDDFGSKMEAGSGAAAIIPGIGTASSIATDIASAPHEISFDEKQERDAKQQKLLEDKIKSGQDLNAQEKKFMQERKKFLEHRAKNREELLDAPLDAVDPHGFIRGSFKLGIKAANWASGLFEKKKADSGVNVFDGTEKPSSMSSLYGDNFFTRATDRNKGIYVNFAKGSAFPLIKKDNSTTLSKKSPSKIPYEWDSSMGMGNNEALIRADLSKVGIRGSKSQAAILANFQAESGLKPKTESTNWSTDKLMELWPHRFNSREDAQRLHDQGPEAMGRAMYGDDGYKYRGRGFIQLSGKSNYEKYSRDIFGDDRMVKNPDIANIPEVASKIAALYMKDNLKGKSKNVSVLDAVKAIRPAGNLVEVAMNRSRYVDKFSATSRRNEKAALALEESERTMRVQKEKASQPQIISQQPAIAPPPETGRASLTSINPNPMPENPDWSSIYIYTPRYMHGV